MAARKFLTREMIVAARENGWNATQTANHYGLHRSSVAAACERFGVELAQSKFNPDIPSTRSRFWKEVVDAATLQPKKKPVFSASPRAVERALEKLQQEKRLQALK